MDYTFLAALVVFAIAIGGMAIGVMLSNRSIKGSCGGLNNKRDERGQTVCGLCSNPAPECQGRQDAEHREHAASQ
jgi:hypothetical protein